MSNAKSNMYLSKSHDRPSIFVHAHAHCQSLPLPFNFFAQYIPHGLELRDYLLLKQVVAWT